MTSHEGRLVDARGNFIGSVRVAKEGELWSGTIDLSGAVPTIRSLFSRFEEAVNNQMLSLVDDLQFEIALLDATLLPPDGSEAVRVCDLQVYPGENAVSFRTGPDPTLVYVRLLGEGTRVFRPTRAIPMGHELVRLLPSTGYEPDDENWEFKPGSVVRVERRKLEGTEASIAISAVADMGTGGSN